MGVIKYSRNIKLMTSNLADRRGDRLQAGCHEWEGVMSNVVRNKEINHFYGGE